MNPFEIFEKHRYRILLAIFIMVLLCIFDNDSYPNQKSKIVTECGTVQMRRVIKRTVNTGESTYTEEVPTLTVRFEKSIENVELGIDGYNKLPLKSTYCRYKTIDPEWPTGHSILIALIWGCVLWVIIETLDGLGKIM